MSQIPDIFPVLAAASKTLLAKSRESLTTRTPHSELVYNYSGSKHVSVSLVSILSLKVCVFFFFLLNSLSFWHEKISESLKRCGISENSTYILVARFAASADEVRWRNQSLFANFCFWHSLSKASCYLVWICHLFHQMVAIEKLIKGKEIDLEEMERKADKPQIQKVHHFFFLIKNLIYSVSCVHVNWWFIMVGFSFLQHYKISAAELGISSLGDAIACRIASRDALWSWM